MRASRAGVGAWAVVWWLASTAAGAETVEISDPDPFVARPRIVVMTDIANEPDDQMSLVRFLVYSNGFDVEGLIATTSTWMKAGPRPDVIGRVLDAYETVQPNLSKHATGFPSAAALREVVATGQTAYGLAATGEDQTSAGSALILRAAEKADPRPLWVLAWGGTNTLAQALMDARRTRTPAQLDAIVAKLRVYAISDQDDAGPWLRREFPGLRWIGTPSTQNGEEYYFATWTGISGDRFYRNAPGADFTTFTDPWVNEHIRAKGPLGKLYPYPCCIHEGDTPSFLGLIDNGLASAMSPAFGGWGGRYVWRQPRGETRAFWTQGGDSYPGNDSSRDTVGSRGPAVHLRPGDHLALAHGVPARLRGAHGLDDQATRGGEPQPGRGRERPCGHRAAGDRGHRRHADRARRHGIERPGWPGSDIRMVLLSGGRERDSRAPRARTAASVSGRGRGRPARPAQLRTSRAAASPRDREGVGATRDTRAEGAGHRPRDPRGDGLGHAEPDVVSPHHRRNAPGVGGESGRVDREVAASQNISRAGPRRAAQRGRPHGAVGVGCRDATG